MACEHERIRAAAKIIPGPGVLLVVQCLDCGMPYSIHPIDRGELELRCEIRPEPEEQGGRPQSCPECGHMIALADGEKIEQCGPQHAIRKPNGKVRRA